MRVLAISSYGGLGGAEIAFAAFLEHRPDDVRVDVLLVSDGAVRERLEALGLPVEAGRGCDGRPNAGMLVRSYRQLMPLLERGDYDVVWAVGQKAAFLSVAACRRKRVPIVWHKVDFSWDRLLAWPLGLACNRAIAVSAAVADTIGPMRGGRTPTLVGPPVQLPRAVSPRLDAPEAAIGTLARLVPYKGHHLIIEAAALLHDEHPNLKVVLAGAEAPEYPGYRERLQDLARARGIASQLELPGFAQAEDVLEQLTVYVNATYRDTEGFGWEGLSGAMLEAGAAGLPVVATRGGGTAEGIQPGVTGTLVATAEPTALAAAIRPYLRDPDLARRTGDAGRSFVTARFSPPVVADRLWGALRDASRGSPGPRRRATRSAPPSSPR